MNNAANNIDAKSKSLKDLLMTRHYKIGYFQREYKWERGNIEDLIVDLERSFFSNWDVSHKQADVANYDKYYMGPIVLFQDKAEFSIVDGQQRLTSFTLLLIYLNHNYEKVLRTKNKLKEYIYSDFYGTESYNLSIEERIPILEFLFRGIKFDDSILIKESCNNLLERYNDITELFPVRLLQEQVLPLFVSWLSEKLVFIEILTQTSESAYTIFETMNDRGLDLTQSEMLKSYLLSNVKDETKIKELDISWKQKIALLNKYNKEEDQDFFKAWFRAKYAISIRTTDKGSVNEDFEKISTRYSGWAQENERRLLNLDKQNTESFYFFVKSDFHFFSDLYLKLIDYEMVEGNPEHIFKLINYKGVSPSLSYPFIISPIEKTDEDETVNLKVHLSVAFLDAFGVYRLLLNEPITHSAIRNAIYLKIKDVRNNSLLILKEKYRSEINEYKRNFLNTPGYIRFENSYAKYILSRIYKNKYPDFFFENIYFQRKKDSFVLFQFFTYNDVDPEIHQLPNGLKDVFIASLCSYCLIPKSISLEIGKMTFVKKIHYLIKNKYLFEFSHIQEFNSEDIKQFFIQRNRKLKEEITNLWKV